MQTGLPRDLAEAENASPFFSRTLEGTSKPISRSPVLWGDATLKVGSETFSVHKIILASSSTVFKSMFENWTTDECVEITEDVGEECWKTLLDHIYGQPITLEPTNIFRLWLLADKYQMVSLSSDIQKVLKELLPLFGGPVVGPWFALAKRLSQEQLQADIVAWTIENFEKVNTDSTESLKTFPVSLWKKILVSDDLVVMNEFHLLLAMINSSGLRPELLLMIRFTQFSWLDLMRVQLKQEFLVLSPALLAKAYRSCCVPRHLLQKLVRGDNPRKYTQVWRHLFTFSVQTSYEADECPKLSLKPEEPFEDFADFTLFFEPNGNATTQTVGNVCISCSGMTIPQGTSYTVSFMLVNQNDLSLLSFATRCEAAQNGTSIGCRVIASTEFCDLSNGWIVDGKALVDVIIVKG